MKGCSVKEFDVFCLHVGAPTPDLRWITVLLKGPQTDTRAVTSAIYRAVTQELTGEGWHILHERFFGSLKVRTEVEEGRASALAGTLLPTTGPLTYIQGHPLWGQGLAGIQIQAFKPTQPEDRVWDLEFEGRQCGRGWQRGGSAWLQLQQVGGSMASAPAPRQATAMIERAQGMLKAAGASYGDVQRTWIYLSNILDWYNEFNLARNHAYGELGLMPQSGDTRPVAFALPASTGIQGDNPLAAACVMDVLAQAGAPAARMPVRRMTNLRQKDAFRYGAAFSRGVAIHEKDYTQIQISGTAAIDESGVSLFPNDMRGQVERTLDNIQALLAQEDATLHDIVSATVFLKRASDEIVVRQILAERGLMDFPGICVRADVCRDDLLFEVDGVAALSRNGA